GRHPSDRRCRPTCSARDAPLAVPRRASCRCGALRTARTASTFPSASPPSALEDLRTRRVRGEPFAEPTVVIGLRCGRDVDAERLRADTRALERAVQVRADDARRARAV